MTDYRKLLREVVDAYREDGIIAAPRVENAIDAALATLDTEEQR